MTTFDTSLVREKIVFSDDGTENGKEPVIIKSNRIFLKLTQLGDTEKIVVRTQNMHTTLQLAAKILFSYYRSGLLLSRETPFDWEGQWDSIILNYEREFNPDLWAAVYINGRSVFKTTTSPFVDVIEQCALLTIDNYDATMDVTESALKKIGRAVRINHNSKVGAIFHDSGTSMRCGIIHRAEGKDSTFSFTAEGGEARNRIVQAMMTAASFLEAINLRHITRSLKSKIRQNQISQASKEADQLRLATARMVSLDKTIAGFEEMYSVQYRPEKPNFFKNV